MRTLCCDVGTSSVRVAIFEYLSDNKLGTNPIAIATRPLNIYTRELGIFEQSSEEIWSKFCSAASECLSHLKSIKDLPFKSIGFSATCSLVIVEDVKNRNSEEHDVIMWMDHRAQPEAELINQSKHHVLKQFGGSCSPEFSLAKLLWIYNNQRNRFNSAKAFMELPDWLSYRCSQWFNQPEKFPRSLCSVVCKWGYDADQNKWHDDLFQHLGMDLNSFREKIGIDIVRPGLPIGYLSGNAAKEIGIKIKSPTINSIKIASSLIDAYAGSLSMLTFFRSLNQTQGESYDNIVCMISGTSTCHIILNKTSLLTKGAWGPYLDPIIPTYYLREAGQSATGALIEHVISSYFKNKDYDFKAVVKDLNNQLKAKKFIHPTSLVINPTFYGNRSPIANSRLKGAIYGITLVDYSLMDIFVSTVEAIAYETKFIFQELEKNTLPIKKVIVSGGLTKNDLYLQMHADVLGHKLITYEVKEASHMLAGASIIAFTASNTYSYPKDPTELIKMLDMIQTDETTTRIFEPREETFQYHKTKYQCFRKLLECCIEIENEMQKLG